MRDDFLYGLRSLRAHSRPDLRRNAHFGPGNRDQRGDGRPDRPRLFSPPEHVSDPARLVSLGFVRGEADQRVRMSTTSYVTFATIRDGVRAFSGVSAFQRTQTTVVLDGEQMSVDAMLVSGSYFDVIGASARLGRPIQPGDDRTAAEPVVVLSHAFWRSTFAGDREVLGRRVTVNGLDYVVSGVMPPRFSGHTAVESGYVDAVRRGHAPVSGLGSRSIPAHHLDCRPAVCRFDERGRRHAGQRGDEPARRARAARRRRDCPGGSPRRLLADRRLGPGAGDRPRQCRRRSCWCARRAAGAKPRSAPRSAPHEAAWSRRR